MIDARTQHHPENAAHLITHASEACGTQQTLADMVGLTPRHIRDVARGKATLTYTLQVTLERIIIDAGGEVSPPSPAQSAGGAQDNGA